MLKIKLNPITSEENNFSLNNEKTFNNYFSLDIIAEQFDKSEIGDTSPVISKDIVISTLSFEFPSKINVEDLQTKKELFYTQLYSKSPEYSKTISDGNLMQFIESEFNSENEIIKESVRSCLEDNYELILNNTLEDAESFDFNSFYSIINSNIKKELNILKNKTQIDFHHENVQINFLNISNKINNKIDDLTNKVNDDEKIINKMLCNLIPHEGELKSFEVKDLYLRDVKALIYKSTLNLEFQNFKKEFNGFGFLEKLLDNQEYCKSKLESISEKIHNNQFKNNDIKNIFAEKFENEFDLLELHTEIQFIKEETIARFHLVSELLQNPSKYLNNGFKNDEILQPFFYLPMKSEINSLIESKNNISLVFDDFNINHLNFDTNIKPKQDLNFEIN